MLTFSLVIPTYGRTEELARQFRALSAQQGVAIEVLLIDQNADNRVEGLLALLGPDITVQHLRQAEPNVSRARNHGLAHATGEIVAFPDDDCWYPAGLLAQVAAWFGANAGYQILSVGAQDEAGLTSGNRWPQAQCDIRPLNCLRTTFCNSLFLRRAALLPGIGFDPAIHHGEETDFVLRLMKAGCRGRFDRSLHVLHPRRDMLSGTVSQQRARQYGEGMGRLVRRHAMPGLWGGLLTYDLVRTCLVVLKGNFSGARFCLAHARGLAQGFLFPYRGSYKAV